MASKAMGSIPARESPPNPDPPTTYKKSENRTKTRLRCTASVRYAFRTMLPLNTPGLHMPDIKRYVRPIDGFAAPDIADALEPGEQPMPFEIPQGPDFDGKILKSEEHGLFIALSNPHASLIDIANDFKVSLETLSVWMMRPDIAARMDAIASASVSRAQFVAKSFLPAAARSAGRIIALHQIARRHNPLSCGGGTTQSERRFDKLAMLASNILVRISKLSHSPNTPSAHKRGSEKSSAKSVAEASPKQKSGK